MASSLIKKWEAGSGLSRGVFISGYGWHNGRMHSGIDVANNTGTQVKAARSGQIVFAGWHDGGYGNLVTLEHADGSRSLYAHNSQLMVRVGSMVRQGTVISLMGNTGRSGRPYLRFEIHLPDAGAVNPRAASKSGAWTIGVTGSADEISRHQDSLAS
jgi:murein DD-endopeptidase MepM/ murein hydrolase activator NlpD